MDWVASLNETIFRGLANSSAPDFRKPSTRVATTQLGVASSLGLFAFFSFSILLKRFPRLYASRRYKVDNLPSWDQNRLFSWIHVLYKIDEHQVLEFAGLDAFVFLGFFKMCIKLLSICCIISITVISPIRYHFTGQYDDGDDNQRFAGRAYIRSVNDIDEPNNNPEAVEMYLWMYVIFTCFFTFLTLHLLVKQTKKIVDTRQKYLGRQNTVTDRTIRITGIPIQLRDEDELKKRIEDLKIGKVASVTICREWGSLNNLFHYRKIVLEQLELKISECPHEVRNAIYNDEQYNLRRTEVEGLQSNDDPAPPHPEESSTASDIENNELFGEVQLKARPVMRTGFLGIFGERVDAIKYLQQQLDFIDEEIREARQKNYPATPTAFVTMDSVANAQMAAQAVLDPRVLYFITRLAPAPHDINWDNISLSRRERLFKVYSVTVFIGLCSVFLVIPVSYIATLLNLKTISKFWPSLGKFLKGNAWAENLVTGLLPTYIFTLFNVVIPYFYDFLTKRQGMLSYSDEELSLVSKNFFYILVNLFFVFTLAGTASNYWGYLSDTTKIAYQLATSVKEFSLFYVDLIIFQGLGMFPFKLLLVGSLIGFPFVKIQSKTPRQRKELYNPPVFNFGLQLPQSILIFIITLIYSIMSTRILTSGLMYFIIGYYVYKYQLIFAMDHLPHSTGKVWPLVYRRVILGLLLFQLTMAGTLAGFQGGWILSSCLFPLPFISLSFWIDFERNYLPLSKFIALSAIREHERDNSMVCNTVDTESYEYPFLVAPLESPMMD